MNMRVLFWLVWVPLAAGCALFEPREAEPPESGTGARFIQPDRPEIVLENLSNAVANLNLQYFLACLDETFVYTPAQSNSTTDPDLWQNWGKDQETLWFNTIRSAATVETGHQLQLQNPQFENISPVSVRVTATYAITMFHNRVSSGVPTVASGSMIVTLSAASNGLWSITQWTDIAAQGGFSWSDLRSAFIRG